MSIPRSRYLDFFISQKETLKEEFELIGDVILIEKIRFPESRTAGGLYIPTTNNQLGTLAADRPHFYRVLIPGEGYFSEDGEDVPLNVKAGDIILVGTVSVKMFSSFPLLDSYEADSIGLTREADIQWRFKGEDKFLSFLSGLNDAAKASKASEAN